MCSPDDPTNRMPWKNVNSCGYFIDEYVQIFDAGKRKFIPFKLWPKQWDALELLLCNGRVTVLKARQIGLTWLCLAIVLWMLIFLPGTQVMLFSLREKEAEDLLKRLKKMYGQLHWWFKTDMEVVSTTSSHWLFDNGNEVRAFSTDSGDGYQANVLLMDESTLVPNLETLLGRVEPVVDSVPNGYLWMISRANKNDPKNIFNRTYLNGSVNINKNNRRWSDWVSLFLSWDAAPWRDKEWYEAEKEKRLSNDCHLDNMYSMYPNDDVEALAPSTSNKRILREWVMAAFEKMDGIEDAELRVSGLKSYGCLIVYYFPDKGKRYCIGVDSAEGLPTSNNSVVCVVDQDTGEEVALLCGKITPKDTANDAFVLSTFYNEAGILCERNNHGFTVLTELERLEAWILEGPDGLPGYRSSKQSKMNLYDNLAELFKEAITHKKDLEKLLEKGLIAKTEKETIIPLVHTSDLALEIMSIESQTLLAPPKHLDDRSDAYAFAQMARVTERVEGFMRVDYTMF